MLYKVYYKLMHSLYGNMPSASHRVRHTRAAVAAHRYEFDVLIGIEHPNYVWHLSAYI